MSENYESKQQETTTEYMEDGAKDSLGKEKKHISIFKVIELLIIIACVIGIVYINYRNDPEIKDGEILRSYESLLKGLEQDPGNIGEVPYEPHIPALVQKDIDMMLYSEEIDCIRYYKEDKSSYISISESEKSPTGISIYISANERYFSDWTDYDDYVSIYKDGNEIVIYGNYFGGRRLQKSILNRDGYDEATKFIENDYIDLYGVNEEFDSIRYYDDYMTLTRKGREFRFYRDGQIIGEPVTFPGGEIKEFSYYFILDENNDLYYMYYCIDPKNPWIKFPKIAEHIDSVIERDFVETRYNEARINFPIYVKGGKKYVAVVDPEVERQFGQNWGRNRAESTEEEFEITFTTFNLSDYVKGGKKYFAVFDPEGEGQFGQNWEKNKEESPEEEFEITFTTINLSDESPSTVTLVKKQYGTYEDEWVLRYNYNIGESVYYVEERVNGLDMYLTRYIGEGELAPFIDREMKLVEVEGVLEKLKALYKKYE